MRLLCFALSFSFSALLNLRAQVQVAPAPSWIDRVSFSASTIDTTYTSGGYYHLLIDKQTHLQKQQRYRRYVIQVTSEKGLSAVSSISESFDPTYEKLVFHRVVIIRQGRTIDKLQKSKFEVLRREENLDRFVYDKSLTAILNLEDVRVGDIVEYSYSVTGVNPVLKGHTSGYIYLNYSEPVGKLYSKLISEKSRSLKFKYFNQALPAKEKSEGGLHIYTWQKENLPAVLREDGLPSWFDPYEHVQYSDFNSWTEVQGWARELFLVNGRDSEELHQKLKQIETSYNDLDKRILACIRFVQAEIRYLSFSDGIHSHKPHEPNLVTKQKFGDCKDKSLLLSHMLRYFGVESSPALVNTEYGHTISEVLPDPWSFDHCIVQFKLRDSTYWIDPTLPPQKGSLKKMYFPSYKNALVIHNTTNEGLTPIPFGIKESMVNVKEDYFLDNLDSSATLKVKSEYYGDEADEIRSYRKSNSQAEINQSYLNFYANEYPDIEAVKDVEFEDDTVSNVVSSTEEYFIKHFWSRDSASNRQTANLYARLISSYLSKPTTKIRTMPLRIVYPRDIHQTIKVHLPEAWNMTETSKKIESAGFVYYSSTRYWENTVTLRYTYRAKSDFIEAREVKNYIAKVDEVYDDLYFNLSYTPNASPNNAGFNYPYLLIAFFVGALLSVLFRKLYWYDPEPAEAIHAYDQIGGWLILLGITLCITPPLLLYSLLTGEYFNPIQWQILTDRNSPSFNPALGSLVLFEFLYELAFLGFGILLVILFFKRRSSLPRLLSLFFAGSFIAVAINFIACGQFGIFSEADMRDNLQEVFKSFFRACIWIPYLLISKRSKATFTERVSN